MKLKPMTPDQFKRIRTDTLALTQEQLAGLLGISRPYLTQMEGGHRVIHHQIGLLMLAFQSGFRPLGWPRSHADTESRAKAPQRVN